jgi:hypothetical protein
MQIVTASWFNRLPPEIAKIGISRSVPRGHPGGYRRVMALAPGPWFRFGRNMSPEKYYRHYTAQLAALDPQMILDRIRELADGRDAALLCFEAMRPGQWCHRAMVSEWLGDTLALAVPEFGDPEARTGRAHPLFPASIRL